MKFSKSLVVAAIAASSFGAQAALTSAQPPVCQVTDTTVNATECGGAFDGNDKNQQADVLAALTDLSDGITGWALAGSSESANGGPFTGHVDANFGTLSFDTPIDGPFAVALKTSTAFSLYYFSGTGAAISSFDFITDGVSLNVRGIAQDLSHASLYTAPVPGIPEPGTYALMLAGLVGMGFVARRRKA